MSSNYYVLIGSSDETGDPVTWQVSVTTEDEVIARAEAECRASNEDLEFFAGFELIGTGKVAGSIGCDTLTWSRDWMPGEKLKASVLKLSDDGRTCKAFNVANPAQVNAFIEQATAVGLGTEAEALVARHSK